MKARLLSDGDLVISAENELEAFALTAWEGRRKNRSDGARLVIDPGSEWHAWEGITKMNEVFGSAGKEAAEFIIHKHAFKEWLAAGKPRAAESSLVSSPDNATVK